MRTVCVSALPAGSVRWQQSSGAWVLTVHSKATYRLEPGSCELAAEQEGLLAEERYPEGDSSRSVRAPTDVVPGKPRAEVVLVGSAFAPAGKPARSLVARLVVAEVEKAIEVFCDRSFAQTGELEEGPAFKQMSLEYERAAGGPETSNPVGIRADARDRYGRRALPNLQRPGLHVTEPDTWIDPVGFGPIAPSWPSRHSRVARFAGAWSPAGWQNIRFPEGFDHAYFNAAPLDQQLGALSDDVRLTLENLHRSEPRLTTSLPGIRPIAFLVGRSEPTPIALRPDTLWIDTDRAICTMTFRGQLQLADAEEAGHVLVGMQRRGEQLSFADLEAASPPVSRSSQTGTMSLSMAALMGGASGGAPLPFRGGAPSTPASQPGGPPRPADDALPFPSRAPSPPSGKAAPDPSTAGGWAAPPSSQATGPASGEWPAPDPPNAQTRRAGAMPAQSMPALAPPPPPARPPANPSAATGPAQSPPHAVPPPPVVAPAPNAAASPWAGGASSVTPRPPGAPAGPSSMGPQPRAPVSPGPMGPGAAQAAAVAPFLARQPEPAPPPPVVVEHRAPVSQIVQLLWFDADCMPRVRRAKAWRSILEALEDRAADPDLDDPALADDAMQLEDRREMFEILAHGKQVGPDAIDRAMRDSVREDGKFVPPLVLSAGELEMRFDELEMLRATTTTAEPLIIVKQAPKPPPPASADEPPPPPPEAPLDPLAVAVAKAKEFLKNPDLLSPPDVSTGLARRIREAYAEEERSMPATYIEEQVDCVLLEKRHYQKRIVFGDTFLRSLWSPNPDEPPIPVYLPQSLTKQLPMYQRFEARWVAEAHPKEDQYEQADIGLKVVALARVTRPKSRT